MTEERRSIESRLENWSRWATAGDGARAAACMTGAICEAMRKAQHGTATPTEYGVRSINTDDAVLVARAMVKVTFTNRRMLGLVYVDGQRRGYIAALLRFAHHEFDAKLAEAQADIAAVLAQPCKNSNSQ